MQTRRGRIVDGRVELVDPDELPDGAEVTVVIADAQELVHASDAELAIIDAGLAAAERPERIDARSFLRQLRSEP